LCPYRCERGGHEIVPLAWAGAVPGGCVTDDAFERMSGLLVDGLARSQPDAVFLELHGAMVTQSHDDGEGAAPYLLAASASASS